MTREFVYGVPVDTTNFELRVDQLESINERHKGTFLTIEALLAVYPNGVARDNQENNTANVDAGDGDDSVAWAWDTSDLKWIVQGTDNGFINGAIATAINNEVYARNQTIENAFTQEAENRNSAIAFEAAARKAEGFSPSGANNTSNFIYETTGNGFTYFARARTDVSGIELTTTLASVGSELIFKVILTLGDYQDPTIAHHYITGTIVRVGDLFYRLLADASLAQKQVNPIDTTNDNSKWLETSLING